MCDNVRIMRERQQAVRREMDRRRITLTVVQLDSGLPPSSVLSYFPNREGKREPAVIPMSAVFTLIETKALPDDLLGLLLPNGAQFVRVHEGVDHHELAAHCRDFLGTLAEAQHPDSPAGTDISDCEDERLRARPIAKLATSK